MLIAPSDVPLYGARRFFDGTRVLSGARAATQVADFLRAHVRMEFAPGATPLPSPRSSLSTPRGAGEGSARDIYSAGSDAEGGMLGERAFV